MKLDPILAELLRNNEFPSEPKLQEAMQLRTQTNEDLLQIDAEIQRLQAKRELIQSSIDIYNTILSPARRLLPDILREIFYHCTDQTYPVLSATEAPMLLTRVCGLWRSVAFSSPRIWARLHIPLPGDPRNSRYRAFRRNDDGMVEVIRQHFSKMIQLRCQAVKDWLDRSGSLPLSLSISHPLDMPFDNNHPEDDELVNLLFRTIRPFASRWRQLDLSMPSHIYQKLETILALDNLTMLPYTKGDTPLSSPISLTSPPPFHIIELPELKALSISWRELSRSLGHYPNSWHRLTDICFKTSVSDADLLEMLKKCHNLVSLDVTFDLSRGIPTSPESPLEMVLLPQLEILKIYEPGPFASRISAINAPHLKSLQFRSHVHNNGSLEPALGRAQGREPLFWFISNAAASLETLSIYSGSSFSLEYISRCFALAIHVKGLILSARSVNLTPQPLEFLEDIHSEFSGDSSILGILKIQIPENESSVPRSTPVKSDIILPKLESLEAYGAHVISDRTLRTILTSRIDAAQCGLTSPLRRVTVQSTRRKREDIIPEIVARARDAGMEMKLDLLYRPSARDKRPFSPYFLLPG
ncbi:hypothetical protein M413DRAFT_27789 [Hebeloma cylindrosporum]|uniref:F-box domain-containing protein n=1 Tax=Hebeloma cylindrosporum TaxID=76867 RepID=A0A0C2YK66_HEBCY|nr:hypothetical protein M413DRAFT_27789 [Hebeloma cylindrosporum h7]